MQIHGKLPVLAGRALAFLALQVALVRSSPGASARRLFILGVAGGLFATPAAIHAQTEAAKFYEQHCVKCHGTDGTGKSARAIEPAIPDFTAASWQTKRTDKQLLESILDGKGQTMPAFRTKKVSEEQALALVAHVRTFAPAKKKSNLPEANEPALEGFEQRFRCLQVELEALQKQFRQLSQASPDAKPAPKAWKSVVPDKATESPPQAPSESSAPATMRRRLPQKLFQEHCVKSALGFPAPRGLSFGSLGRADPHVVFMSSGQGFQPCKSRSFMRCIHV
jgi:mono/diheme cytochrome c family protein